VNGTDMMDRQRQRIATWTLAAGLLVLAAQDLYAAAPAGPQTQPASRPASSDPFADRRVGSGLSSETTEDGQARERGDDFGYGLAKTLLALVIVAALIFLVRYLLRRLGMGPRTSGRSGAMEILARAPVSARQQLLLVRLGGHLVLVGSSAETMAPLAEVSDPAEVADLLRAVGRSPAEALTSLRDRTDRVVAETSLQPEAPPDGGQGGAQ